MGDLLGVVALRHEPPAPVAPVGPQGGAGNAPLDLGSINRRASVGQCLGGDHNLLTEFGFGLGRADFGIELRPLVFLDADRLRASRAADEGLAEDPVDGSGEAAAE